MEKFNVKGFLGGNQASPEWFEDYDTLSCKKCKIKPKEISRKKQFYSTAITGRGTLNVEWDEIIIQCPKCKTTEKYDGDEHESDGSYYSNEERRAYRNYD